MNCFFLWCGRFSVAVTLYIYHLVFTSCNTSTSIHALKCQNLKIKIKTLLSRVKQTKTLSPHRLVGDILWYILLCLTFWLCLCVFSRSTGQYGHHCCRQSQWIPSALHRFYTSESEPDVLSCHSLSLWASRNLMQNVNTNFIVPAHSGQSLLPFCSLRQFLQI